ncbi:DUF4241 domain-containing protein [Micromonosporaceae bacterium Da 78-11]
MSYSPDLGALSTDGARHLHDGVEFVISAHEVGTVTAPSGQIVGCDPLVNADSAHPFVVRVPPGRYRLRAWVATIRRAGEDPQEHTVALQLEVGSQPAVRWEPALVDGQELAELGPDDFFGYPVDAGVVTLADLVAVRALAGWDFNRMDEVYIPAQVPPDPAAVDAITDDPTGANVIIVNSGWGDGVYPTFIGYAADGRVTGFVTDFMVDSGSEPISLAEGGRSG